MGGFKSYLFIVVHTSLPSLPHHTPHGADVEAIVDRLCVQPHLAEAVLSKLVGVLQPQR